MNLVNHEKQKENLENLAPEYIRKLIYMWKNNVKKEDQIYYDNILYIIDENFDIKFPSYIKNKNAS